MSYNFTLIKTIGCETQSLDWDNKFILNNSLELALVVSNQCQVNLKLHHPVIFC